MLKSGVSRGARRNRPSAGRATLPNALEGHIEEICRDMAVQVKRMRQLQEQADELRTAFRQWAGPARHGDDENRLIVQDDAEK